MPPAFRFVSLGSDCQPAAQINNIQPPGQSKLSYPFDWITTQIQHIGRLIENDFEGFLDPANLFPNYFEEQFKGMVDTVYRVGLNHDFVDFNEAEIQRVRDVYMLRVRWFLNLFDTRRPPPYFIRRWHPRDGIEDERLVLELFEVLRRKRRDIRLLYLHADPSRAEFMADGYRSAFLKQNDPFVWYGDGPTWSHMLNNFALRFFEGDRQAFVLPVAVPEVQRPRFG